MDIGINWCIFWQTSSRYSFRKYVGIIKIKNKKYDFILGIVELSVSQVFSTYILYYIILYYTILCNTRISELIRLCFVRNL